MRVLDILEQARETFKERAKVYGPSYKMHGNIMSALFPDGLKLETAEDFNRFALIDLIVVKLNRYATSFERGSVHIDSIHDLGVYAFMLEDCDTDKQERDANDSNSDRR